jgi:hypothetical protein
MIRQGIMAAMSLALASMQQYRITMPLAPAPA